MDQELVTIGTYRETMEANLVRSRLEAEGIMCFLADEHLVQMNWLYSDAVGGVKLQVAESDAEAAIRILRGNPNLAGAGLASGEQAQPEVCPRCGSEDVASDATPKRLVVLSWLLLGLPLAFIRRRWRCEACAFKWKGQV